MKKYISIFILTMTVYCASCVYSMDQAAIVDDPVPAWEIVLQRGVRYFDYIMINSLAVSKSNDKYLRNTAHCRKKYLTEQLGLSENITWHKYGAMASKVTHDICSVCFTDQDFSLEKIKRSPNSGLYRERYYLARYNAQNRPSYSPHRQPCTVYNSDFYSCLPHQPQAFFNDQSDFCFHGYSIFMWNQEKTGRVIEYVWRSSRRASALELDEMRCMTNIKNEKELIDLTIFLELPVLLKAFLESCIVYKKPKSWGMDYKIYAIEGVKIPENYKDYKQYFPTPMYASFEDLPKNIREAIVARYEEQGKKD